MENTERYRTKTFVKSVIGILATEYEELLTIAELGSLKLKYPSEEAAVAALKSSSAITALLQMNEIPPSNGYNEAFVQILIFVTAQCICYERAFGGGYDRNNYNEASTDGGEDLDTAWPEFV